MGCGTGRPGARGERKTAREREAGEAVMVRTEEAAEGGFCLARMAKGTRGVVRDAKGV